MANERPFVKQVTLPGIFQANGPTPIDNRFVLDKKVDLYTDPFNTFGGTGDYTFIYDGLEVYVRDEKAVYIYVGPYDIDTTKTPPTQNGVLTTEAKKEANWVKIADNKGLKGITDYVDDAIDDNIGAIDFSEFYKSSRQATLEDSNYTAETADLYKFGHGDEEDDLQLTFTPLSPLALTMPEAVGDLEKGTTSASLNGKPLSEILDSILFKTIYPTVTNPSLKITGSPTATQEPNTTIWSGYNYTFDKGTVVVDDGVTASIDYVGGIDGTPTYQVKYTLGATNATDFPIWNAGDKPTAVTDGAPTAVTRYEVGQYQYRVSIDYLAGPTMKTSKGATTNPMKTTNAGSVINPHPAGSLTSSYGCTINVTLPVFIDSGSGYVKQALKTWGAWTFTGIQMSGTTAAAPIKIKTPRSLKSANSYNEVSSKYDVAQLSNFTKTQITEEINGVEYIYFEYVWTGGAAGAVAYEIITN
ncbi:MAG: hypothetical protein J1F35_03515 [Erysipelotrichales bacterium]|nr:hypothetical protein [Erysipelotrichales bacterium]